MSKILVVSNDIVGAQMAGPGIRAWHLAHQLARENEVRLAAPSATPPVTTSDLTLVRYEPDGVALKEQVDWAQVLILQGWSAVLYPFLLDPSKMLALDMFNPSFFENLVDHADDVEGDKEYNLQFNMELARDLLAVGDFFICGNERQRDFWLGWLTALGRVNHLTYRDDPSLRNLIDVVTFGVADEPPRHTARVLKGVWPGIGADDRVALWGGGLWQWLDPVICVEAMQRLAARRPDIKLFFTTGAVSALPPQMTAARRARQLSDEYGLTGQQVFFSDAWLAYDQVPNYLLEADLAVLAHRPHIETHFSNRTRLFDCIWAALPIVTTRGDVWSEWVERYELGQCVEHDADQIAQAIIQVLETPRDSYRPRFEQAAAQFSWQRVVEPLARFCAHPAKAPDHQAAALTWKEIRLASAARRESELIDVYRRLGEMVQTARQLEGYLAERDKHIQLLQEQRQQDAERHQQETEQLLAHISKLQDHIRAIQNGRVMRTLNCINAWLGRDKPPDNL